jgi:hypothetical protein
VLTDEGQRVAIFYTKVYERLLRPSWQPTNHLHHQDSEMPCTPSILT